MPKKGRTKVGRKPKCGTGRSSKKAMREIGMKANGNYAKSTSRKKKAQKGRLVPDRHSTPRSSLCESVESTSITSTDSTIPTSMASSVPPTHPSLPMVTPITSEYKRKCIERARDIEFDPNAFSEMNSGKKRKSEEAANLAQRREVNKSVASLKKYNDDSKTLLVLKGLVNHPDMAPFVKAAGIIPTKEQEVAMFNHHQQQEAFNLASETDNPRGRPNEDQRNFIRAAAISIAPNDDSIDVPKKYKRMATLGNGMSRATRYRLLDKAANARKQLMEKVKGIRWSGGRSRKEYSKVTPQIRAALRKWILEHPDVVESPIVNDTLKVRNPDTGKKDKIVAKQLRMISVRDLHNDLLKPVNEGGFENAYKDGKVLISDTMLRTLMPEEMRKMTERYKQMCGCETCIVGRRLLRSLKAYRTRVLRKLKKDARRCNGGSKQGSCG